MRYVARKFALFLVTLWAAITLNFALPRLMPGSPVDAALAKLASSGTPVTDAQRHAIEIQLVSKVASIAPQFVSIHPGNGLGYKGAGGALELACGDRGVRFAKPGPNRVRRGRRDRPRDNRGRNRLQPWL